MKPTLLETFCQKKKKKCRESDTENTQKRRRSSFSQDYMPYFQKKSEFQNFSCGERNWK